MFLCLELSFSVLVPDSLSQGTECDETPCFEDQKLISGIGNSERRRDRIRALYVSTPLVLLISETEKSGKQLGFQGCMEPCTC